MTLEKMKLRRQALTDLVLNYIANNPLDLGMSESEAFKSLTKDEQDLVLDIYHKEIVDIPVQDWDDLLTVDDLELSKEDQV